MSMKVILGGSIAALVAVGLGVGIVHGLGGTAGGHGAMGVHAMHGVIAISSPEGATPMYAEREFDFVLPGTVAALTPYFGPVKEREWAPDWHPQFIRPADGGQEAGAVFQTQSEWGTATWVMDHYDPQLGKVGYVIVIPDTGVTRYAIALSQQDADHVHVHVWCSRTLLKHADPKYLAQFEQFFTSQGPEWHEAITGMLSRTANARPAQ